MYGYITPYKPELTVASWTVYKAFYCGLCKATKVYGQIPRVATNYDMTFVAALLHDYITQEVVFGKEPCITNPFRKRVFVERNQLLDRITAANILLVHYKLVDDVYDGGGLKKKFAKRMFARAHKKAAAILPEVDAVIDKRYTQLREFEKENCDSLDRASHPFAELTAEVGEIIIMTNEAEEFHGIASSLMAPRNDSNFRALCYNIGKFIYLIDALDDVTEDFKKKRYNPFIAAYGNFINRRQFFDDNADKIAFVTATVLNRAAECFNGLELTQSNSLLKNIVHKGLRHKLEQVLKSNKKVGSLMSRQKIKENYGQPQPL